MSIRRLSSDFAFYGVLDFVQRSFSILLVPIYTRVLSQASYGNLDLILTVMSVLTVLADLQFGAGFTRLYLENRKAGRGPLFAGTTILTRVGLGSLLAAVFLGLGYGGLLEVKALPSFLANRQAWTLAVLNIPVTFSFDILLVQSQMLRWKKWFFAGAFGNTLLMTVLSIVFTVGIPLGIVGVVLAQFLAKCVSTGLLYGGLRAEVSAGVLRNLLKDIASYSLPLVPGRWVGHADTYLSRFFIYASLGPSENAILAITTKVAAVLGLFSVAFRTAWQPLAMAYIDDDKGETFYVRSLRLLAAGGLFSVFAVSVLCRPLLIILAPNAYAITELYAPFFLMALIITEMENSLQLGNQISKKSYWISISAGVAFSLNFLVLIFLSVRFGIYAAGGGALLSSVARATVTYYSSQRNYRIAYDLRALTMFVLGCAALLALSIGRAMEIIKPAAFYGAAGILALALPWFTLNSEDRQVARAIAVGSLQRLQNARRTRQT